MKQKSFRTLISIFTQSWPINLVSLVLGIVSFSTSCKESKKFSLEKQLLPDAAGILAVDTFRISVETIRVDAPSTKNKPHLIVGDYVDPDFGHIHSEAFTQLRYYGYDTLKFGAGVVIDSISMRLYPDFLLGTDTANYLSFGVHLLSEAIDSAKDYNHTSILAYESNAMANFSFKAASRTTQTVSLSSGSEFQKLARLFLDAEYMSRWDFIDHFKGFGFIPTSKNTYGVGFSTGQTSSFNLYVYFHLPGQTSSSFRIFSIFDNRTLTTSRFTRVVNTVDPSLPISKLGSGNASVPSSELENKGYMNDALGIRTRISIPGLKSFLNQIEGQYLVSEAVILVPSSNQAYVQETNKPTPALSLIECDPAGEPLLNSGDSLSKYKIIQSEVFNSGRGNLDGVGNDYYSGFQNYYKRFYYPFTLYTQEIAKGQKDNNPFIPSLSSSFGNSVSQSPLGYTFYDRSQPSGIRMVIVLNKLN